MAVALGAYALGLNFYPGSPRCVTQQQAEELLQAVPGSVLKVGLFVDAQPSQVRSLLAALPLDLLQFHGKEAPDYCASFQLPYIKAVPGRRAESIAAEASRHPSAASILVDTAAQGAFGGTGKCFDWRILPPLQQKLMLAGGLNPSNVAAAIHQAAPFAVDVCSGVEASKGVKDHDKMQAFFAAVEAADSK